MDSLLRSAKGAFPKATAVIQTPPSNSARLGTVADAKERSDVAGSLPGTVPCIRETRLGCHAEGLKAAGKRPQKLDAEVIELSDSDDDEPYTAAAAELQQRQGATVGVSAGAVRAPWATSKGHLVSTLEPSTAAAAAVPVAAPAAAALAPFTPGPMRPSSLLAASSPSAAAGAIRSQLQQTLSSMRRSPNAVVKSIQIGPSPTQLMDVSNTFHIIA